MLGSIEGQTKRINESIMITHIRHKIFTQKNKIHGEIRDGDQVQLINRL